jgi:hypothetical protein
LLVAVCGALITASVASAGTTTTTTYAATKTLPVPPASNYAGAGGGDGWAVALSNTQVFNIFHHNGVTTLACHNQSDASQCYPQRTITDGSGHDFATSGHPDMFLDQSTGKLYTYGTRSIDSIAGVVCIDTTAAAANPNPFCGFTALTTAADAPLSGGISGLSNPIQVGTKLYAFNFVNGSGGGGGAGGRNRLLCFDLSTFAACAGQPVAVNIGAGNVAVNSFPTPAISGIGNRVVIPIVTNSPLLACFDASTGADCAGTWPVAAPGGYPGNAGPPFPRLDGTGKIIGLCLPTGAAPCYDLTGAGAPTPAGLAGALASGSSVSWDGPGFVLGPRVYVPEWSNVVACYDYSAGASCTNFPKHFNNLGLLYTVNPDPQRPACLWVNADNGAAQIQNFDAFTGGACGAGAIRVLAAQFVVPQPPCTPDSYVSFQITNPARNAYSSGSVAFEDANGNPIPGASDRPLDATGTVDLTGLNLNTALGLPQFLITLNGLSGTVGSVTVKLTWNANYNQTCVGSGTTVTKTDVTTTTSLTGGGKSGASITVPTGTAVTDSASLAGTDAAQAGGTVTYSVYSDSTCQTPVAGGTAQSITTPGSPPSSSAVTLSTPGTYYWVATYSGDAGNNSSSSACGSEVETVVTSAPADTTPPSCALTAVIAGPPKQIQITVQDSESGLASIEVMTSTNANTAVPAFAVGTTSPVVVTATKIDQSTGAVVELRATDVAGNVTVCDPAIVTIKANPGKPVSTVVTGIAQAESSVAIYNNTPGLRQLDIRVNGELFRVTRLHNGEVRTIDVAKALKPGTHNTVVLTARGSATGNAEVVISDMGKHTAAQNSTKHVVAEVEEQGEH